jgi:hypothetical protein
MHHRHSEHGKVLGSLPENSNKRLSIPPQIGCVMSLNGEPYHVMCYRYVEGRACSLDIHALFYTAEVHLCMCCLGSQHARAAWWLYALSPQTVLQVFLCVELPGMHGPARKQYEIVRCCELAR